MSGKYSKAWAPLALMFFSGCSREFADDRLTLMWAVPPLAAFGVLGMFWVLWHRKNQLAQWDLRSSPSPPDAWWAVWVLSGVAGSMAVGFAVLNFLADDVSMGQKLQNILFWTVGSTMAVSLAAYFGRMLAERGYSRREN